MHSYPPPVNADDIESYQKNLSLLNAELSKPKPRTDVLKMLMTRTFNNRFQELLSGDKPVSARDHVTKYPLLKKPAYVCQFTVSIDVMYLICRLPWSFVQLLILMLYETLLKKTFLSGQEL